MLGRLNVDQSQVRTLTQQQQIITLRNDLAKQKINLARLTGLPPNAGYQLTDSFPFSPAPVQSVDAAVAQAEQQRADLKAAQSQVEAAAKALSAARAERLPSVAVSGDYEVIGTNPAQSHGAFAVVGTLSIPLWQGGRTAGDIAQAEAVLAQRQAELEDTRGQIEAEVRQAYLDLEAAAGQVEVARKNRAGRPGNPGDGPRAHGSRGDQYGGGGAGATDGRQRAIGPDRQRLRPQFG